MELFSERVITALIGLAGGAIAVLCNELIKRATFNPELQLYFRNSHDCVVPTVAREYIRQSMPLEKSSNSKMGYLSVPQDRHFIYVRVRVTNTNPDTAKNTRGFLVRVERADSSGEFRPTIYTDSIPLCWSYLSEDVPQVADIPRNVNFYLDVLSTEKGSSKITPRFIRQPNKYADLFAEPGIYRLTVCVTADGAVPQLIQIIVNWSGVWDQLNVDRDLLTAVN